MWPLGESSHRNNPVKTKVAWERKKKERRVLILVLISSLICFIMSLHELLYQHKARPESELWAAAGREAGLWSLFVLAPVS